MRKLFLSLAIVVPLSVAAEDMAAVRAMASEEGTVLSEGVWVEGVIVSDWKSYNLEHNPNLSYDKVDIGESYRTAYLQNSDGSLGLRLKFESIYDNRFDFGTKVKISLGGALALKEPDPDRYTISGLSSDDVEVLESGVEVPAKFRSISELKDEDIYTWVTLTDVEFSSKQGAYINIAERFAQVSKELNEYSRDYSRRTLPYMDSWASMLLDSRGCSIYMLLNTRCPWRRNTFGVPQGVGKVSGIAVHARMRRYGGDMGRYSIRPVKPDDIEIAKESETSYRTLASWNWDRNYQCALDFEKAGKVLWVPSAGVASDAVKADSGQGLLYLENADPMALGREYDARHSHDGFIGLGERKHAALLVRSNTQSWYVFEGEAVKDVKGLVAKVPVNGASGNGVLVTFSFAAADGRIEYSYNFPCFWKIQYSSDGKSWTDAQGRNAVLRPLPYKPKNVRGVGMRYTSYDAALGFTEHSFTLPSSVLGQEELYVRLAPVSDIIAALPEDPAEDTATGKAYSYTSEPFTLYVGSFNVRIY